MLSDSSMKALEKRTRWEKGVVKVSQRGAGGIGGEGGGERTNRPLSKTSGDTSGFSGGRMRDTHSQTTYSTDKKKRRSFFEGGTESRLRNTERKQEAVYISGYKSTSQWE